MSWSARPSSLRWIAIVMAIILLVYVGSYAVLSRRGMAQSRAMGIDGLYFFPPEDNDSWRTWNYACVTFYYPLIMIETWIGTVEGVGCEPLWRLSASDEGDVNGTPPAERSRMAAAPSPLSGLESVSMVTFLDCEP